MAVLRERRKVLKRFGMSMEELKKELKFSAVIVSCLSARIFSFTQILADILNSTDGSLHGPPRQPGDPQKVAFITTNPDLVFATNYYKPRIGPRGAEIMIKACIESLYGWKLETEQYGKPYTFNFDYAEEYLRKLAARRAIRVSNFYMIGDNPESDIKGAIDKGWVSILVSTGVFDAEKHQNDSKYPASHVVKDFRAAIELIYKLEGLDTSAIASIEAK